MIYEFGSEEHTVLERSRNLTNIVLLANENQVHKDLYTNLGATSGEDFRKLTLKTSMSGLMNSQVPSRFEIKG